MSTRFPEAKSNDMNITKICNIIVSRGQQDFSYNRNLMFNRLILTVGNKGL